MKKFTKVSALLLLSLSAYGCNLTLNTNTPTSSKVSSSVSNNLSTSNSEVDELNLEHSIAVTSNDNCTIEVSKSKAYRNEVITIEVSNITKGYVLQKITVNGYLIDGNSFIMPAENVVVDVFLVLVEDQVNGTTRYYVKKEANKYALIETAKDYYAPGETVDIEYTCKGTYVLSSFYVNGEAIEGTSFVMPEDSVVISGTFEDAIPYTPWETSTTCSGMTATSNWYFTYGEEGLEVNVKVEDNRVCGDEFVLPANSGNTAAYSDNIEFILGEKSDIDGRVTNKTYKFLVSYDNRGYVQKASSATAWSGTQSLSSLIYKTSTSLKSLENKDGYNGYEVNIFIAYGVLGLTRDTAVNNLTTCLALRNTTTYGGSGTAWNCFRGDMKYWNYCSNQPIIMEDGSLLER